MRIGSLAVLGCSLLLSGCALPRHGGVFAYKAIVGGGLIDRSADYSGSYVRATNTEAQVGLKGGSATHHHNIEHVHEGKIAGASPVMTPIGTSQVAASATHCHSYFTQNQRPIFSGDAPNDFSHVDLGFYIRERFAVSVPHGVVIGYLGKNVPDGWALVDGAQGRPSLDGMLIRIGPAAKWGEATTASAHTHTVEHTHDVIVREADPADGNNVQTFEASALGQYPALPNHGHLVTDVTMTSATVEPVKPEIPELRMAFLVSTKKGAHLPSGAVIAMTKKHVPVGWTPIGEVRNPEYAVSASEGYFLAGKSLMGAPTAIDAPTTHAHAWQHTHTGQVGVAVGVSPLKAATGSIAPNIAPADHTHPFQIQAAGTTGEATHLPPYVQFFLIVKN